MKFEFIHFLFLTENFSKRTSVECPVISGEAQWLYVIEVNGDPKIYIIPDI